jgi:hypothetical protein
MWMTSGTKADYTVELRLDEDILKHGLFRRGMGDIGELSAVREAMPPAWSE